MDCLLLLVCHRKRLAQIDFFLLKKTKRRQGQQQSLASLLCAVVVSLSIVCKILGVCHVAGRGELADWCWLHFIWWKELPLLLLSPMKTRCHCPPHGTWTSEDGSHSFDCQALSSCFVIKPTEFLQVRVFCCCPFCLLIFVNLIDFREYLKCIFL